MERAPYSEGIILQVTRRLLDHAREFFTDLKQKAGFTKARLKEIEARHEKTQNLRSAEAGKIILKRKTARKDDALARNYAYGQRVRKRLKLAYGKNSPEFRSFPSKELTAARTDEKAMMSVMELILDIVQEYKEALMKRGMTAEMIELGPQLLKTLRASDADQEKQKADNTAETAKRNKYLVDLYQAANEISDCGVLAFPDDPEIRKLFENPWPSRTSSKSNEGD
ncbi:MAG TPA: hypothetical protein VKA68_16600 [bacterium]|nr:hypothetical protein [bacterium]